MKCIHPRIQVVLFGKLLIIGITEYTKLSTLLSKLILKLHKKTACYCAYDNETITITNKLFDFLPIQ